MSLKFGEIKLNKKEFHRAKQPIYLNQIEISKIVISTKFKLDDAFQIVLNTKMVKLLNHDVLFYLRWVDWLNILKTKNRMSFLADDDVILKYNKIWKKMKKLLIVEFDSQPVYDEK